LGDIGAGRDHRKKMGLACDKDMLIGVKNLFLERNIGFLGNFTVIKYSCTGNVGGVSVNRDPFFGFDVAFTHSFFPDGSGDTRESFCKKIEKGDAGRLRLREYDV
jgi:hypothetical protein